MKNKFDYHDKKEVEHTTNTVLSIEDIEAKRKQLIDEIKQLSTTNND